MLLTAVLLAAEADSGAVQASAEEPKAADPGVVVHGDQVQLADGTSAPIAKVLAETGSNDSKLAAAIAQAAKAAEASSSSSSSGANEAGSPAADVGSGMQGALLVALMGMPVIVRQGGRIAPGMIVEEDTGSGITVQVFRGDHLPHVAHHLERTGPRDTSDGWFFPWEREHLANTHVHE